MSKKIAGIFLSVVMTISGFAFNAAADKWVETESGVKYEYTNGTYAKKGWLTVNDNKYYIQKDGTRKTGWLSINGDKYYFNKNGKMQTGKITVNQKDYTLSNNGKLISNAIHFVVNTDTMCLHTQETCTAAKKIKSENRDELYYSKDNLSDLSKDGYWACGKCSKLYSKTLPKPNSK